MKASEYSLIWTDSIRRAKFEILDFVYLFNYIFAKQFLLLFDYKIAVFKAMTTQQQEMFVLSVFETYFSFSLYVIRLYQAGEEQMVQACGKRFLLFTLLKR